uniref:Uncharacterized protein n=1 Tax=Rhizophora mucronata TaxID=61149 RepID=A0A2P2Q248_RHIMU
MNPMQAMMILMVNVK